MNITLIPTSKMTTCTNQAIPLGDRLQDHRYEIVDKLGYSLRATGRLAMDDWYISHQTTPRWRPVTDVFPSINRRFVAIMVWVAIAADRGCRPAPMSHYLTFCVDIDHPGRDKIMRMLNECSTGVSLKT